MPTPDWARCHLEIYEAPGFLDDCFRSSLWTLFQSAASQSFVPGSDVTGDLAAMTVTEGGSPSGCGYRKDLTGVDQVRFWFKYGSGLSPENLEVRMQKGSWPWTTDYYVKLGLSVPSVDTWSEYTVEISDFSITGNPGTIVARIQIRAYRGSGDMGTGGFKIDKLRFLRTEKKGTSGDAASQAVHGKRTLRVVDKTITDTGYAGYVAENIVEHRKNPVVTVEAVVPGRGQPGFRPPMTVPVSSLKDGLDGVTMQIQRARHHYSPGKGYTCTLELVAGKKPDGSYEAGVAPVQFDLAAALAAMRRRQGEQQLNSLRSRWE